MSYYVYFKALHIISLVCWFAALFYLPRLFVYHARCDDKISSDRFIIMERRLYRGIANPAMMATWIFGLILLWLIPSWLQMGWMHAKLALVVILTVYHCSMGYFLRKFRDGTNTKTHTFFRFYNEFPTILLITIVILVTVKPF